jgi:Protein of unknown function (DUF2924)
LRERRERSWESEQDGSPGEARPLDETLAREIEGLRKLKTKALRARYQELFGEETGSWNQAHLYRRMAWRLQAQALGGLSERAQRRAGELAEEASLRLRAPRPFWREDGSVGRAAAPARDERLPPIGTVLQRNYRGETIEVEVLARGFGYRGQVYGSLSQLAQRITGTRWNGYAFFGLPKAGRSSMAAPWR